MKLFDVNIIRMTWRQVDASGKKSVMSTAAFEYNRENQIKSGKANKISREKNEKGFSFFFSSVIVPFDGLVSKSGKY